MTKITNNQRETIAVIDDVTGNPMYLKGLNGALDVNATISSATVSGAKSNNAGVPGTTNLGVLPAVATAAAPSYSEGNQVGLSTDLAGNVRITGSISVGGTTDNSAFTAGSSTGTAAMGFYHSTIDTVTDGRAATVAITAKRAMMVNLQTSAGAETGIAALPLQVSLANTGANTNKLLVTPDSVALPANQSVNISQINAVTPLMGNGLTGTGSLRVTIASDNTAFAVNSTLSAETTKVIGTINVAASQTIAVTNTGTFATQSTLAAETTKVIGVTRTADGAGNLLTSNSTTYTAKFGLDGNLLGTLGTAFSTAGKVDVKGADGDVFVRQATASNLNATVVGTGTFAVQATLAAETTKVLGVVRTADGSGNLLTSTTNALDVNIKTSAASNISTNIAQINGVTPLMGNGATGTGALRVSIANDSTGVVQPGNTQNTTPWLTAPSANTGAVGATFNYQSALNATKVQIKGTAGNLYGYHMYNPNSAATYIQVFNKASANVTVGSTAPDVVLVVPPNGWIDAPPGVPIAFGTGITVAATTTASGSTNPTTNLTANIWYI